MTEIVRRVEEADLESLKSLDVADVYQHIDSLMDERPGPVELYRRWERQNWSASELDFSEDRIHWMSFDQATRDDLSYTMSAFFVGEQRVTDTLAPLIIGAPDEENRLFLSTQLVDEARHSFFFSRYFSEVLEQSGGFTELLAYAERWASSEIYREIFYGLLPSATEAVITKPTYSNWIRGVTTYHLMIEGILALTAQRQLLEVLRTFQILPGFRAGFTAVTRDESRHVNYGVWAVQQAAQNGFEGDVIAAVDAGFDPCLRLFANPEFKVTVSPDLPEEARYDWRREWSFAINNLTKRLKAAGVTIDGLEERGWKVIAAALDEYESRHGETHPAREVLV